MRAEQEQILRKLMHVPGLSFNRLWEHEGRSNRFAYHLRSLETEGFVEKQNDGYVLTHAGKKRVAYVDGETGKRVRTPLLGVIIVVVDSTGDKFLMLERTKEPFFGYWGFHAGKMEFSQYILETAAAELKGEAGLECDLELKGLFSSKTHNNGELSYNHQMFVVKATNPRGEILVKTREGKNRWIDKKDVASLKTFPNVSNSIDIVTGQGFRWVEMDRFQEDEEFKEGKILRDERL